MVNNKEDNSVLDLFAGAGGFSLGFKFENYQIKYALEIDEWAVQTLKYNHKNTNIISGDIRDYKSSPIIKKTVNNNIFDVIIGGPPCQGFSIANKKSDPKDPRNSLFMDFARWVEVLNPKVFVMENVKGIINRINSNNEKVIDIIKNRFTQIGYSVEIWSLNAVNFGVPQYRERIFIVGNRYGKLINQPKPTSIFFNNSNEFHEISVGEAILDLPLIEAGEGSDMSSYTNEPTTTFQKWARGSESVLYNHEAMKHTDRLINRFQQIKWGESNSKISQEYLARKRNGNGEHSNVIYHMNNRRLDPDKPSFTIPASFYSTFIHPYQNRNITAREAARIQSFPDSYRFFGKRTVISSKLLQRKNRHSDNHLSQYNQIGNAVPPLLSKAIAEHIKYFLSENY